MQAETAGCSREEVRCPACHTIYELPLAAATRDAPACPDCGAVVWLAATIPVPEAEPVLDQ